MGSWSGGLDDSDYDAAPLKRTGRRLMPPTWS